MLTRFAEEFRNQALIAASGPAPPDDRMPRILLEEIRTQLGGDAGAALLFFGPGGSLASAEITLHTLLGGEGRRLLRGWLEAPEGPAARCLREAAPVEVGSGDPSLPSGVGRALWIPLVEGRRMVEGAFLVARTADREFADAHLREATELADLALPGLNRLLLRRRLAAMGRPHDVIGISPALLDLERRIRLVGRAHTGSVLILGERGSGKELVASSLHAWSDRRSQPFLPVLASAFSEGMVADELFGHETHSFTGAAAQRLGKFGAANGGTLFLDEVGDLPMPVQSALMRILEYGELPRIGRDLPVPVDVRVVTATNRDLDHLMARSAFRQDLYDRLRMFELRVPPLHERPEDVPLLASAFVRRHCEDLQRPSLLADLPQCGGRCHAPLVGCTAHGVFDHLARFRWPGNVRELKHVIQSAVAGAPDEILHVGHLPGFLHREPAPPSTPAPPVGDDNLSLDGAIRDHIERVLVVAGQNQTRAAGLLGLPLSTLRNKMKRLGINPRDGRRSGPRSRSTGPARTRTGSSRR